MPRQHISRVGWALKAGENERSLVERVTSGEAGAWDDLVDRFIGLVYHTMEHTAQAQKAQLEGREREDLCAEVFGGLLAHNLDVLRQFAWQSNFETWLAVHARRHVLWRLHQKRLADKMESSPARSAPEPEPAPPGGPDDDTPARPDDDMPARPDDDTPARPDETEPSRPDDALSDVGRRMDGLPWLEAQVVRLHYLENRPDDEIARSLDIDLQRVTEILRQADPHTPAEDQTRAGEAQT